MIEQDTNVLLREKEIYNANFSSSSDIIARERNKSIYLISTNAFDSDTLIKMNEINEQLGKALININKDDAIFLFKECFNDYECLPKLI